MFVISLRAYSQTTHLRHPTNVKVGQIDQQRQIILIILFLVLVLVRGGGGGVHEPHEAQPDTEGVGGVQGGSPVSPWWNNGEVKIHTSRGGETVTTMRSKYYIKQKLVERVPHPQPGK